MESLHAQLKCSVLDSSDDEQESGQVCVDQSMLSKLSDLGSKKVETTKNRKGKQFLFANKENTLK